MGRRAAAAALCAVLAGGACTSAAPPDPTTAPALTSPAASTSPAPPPPTTLPRTSSSSVQARTTAPPKTTAVPHSPAAPRTSAPQPPSGDGRLIVVDPGHSPTAHGTDPETGLDTSEYENEPEMRDVYDIALLVRDKLRAAGYRVIVTKSSAGQPITLDRRADIANSANAALGVSIHDQAGSNGGLAFDSANNNVYYQSVGDYRENPQGKRIYFTDKSVAAASKRYGAVFQQQRAAAEGHSVSLLGNTGYDLGSRGLQPGNIWIVQLLSHVPWIYNEAGGNSAGMSGLNTSDKQRYANGIVAGVEHCRPLG